MQKAEEVVLAYFCISRVNFILLLTCDKLFMLIRLLLFVVKLIKSGLYDIVIVDSALL